MSRERERWLERIASTVLEREAHYGDGSGFSWLEVRRIVNEALKMASEAVLDVADVGAVAVSWSAARQAVRENAQAITRQQIARAIHVASDAHIGEPAQCLGPLPHQWIQADAVFKVIRAAMESPK